MKDNVTGEIRAREGQAAAAFRGGWDTSWLLRDPQLGLEISGDSLIWQQNTEGVFFCSFI